MLKCTVVVPSDGGHIGEILQHSITVPNAILTNVIKLSTDHCLFKVARHSHYVRLSVISATFPSFDLMFRKLIKIKAEESFSLYELLNFLLSLFVRRVEPLVIFFGARVQIICLQRSEATAAEIGEHVHPLNIPGIIQRSSREVVNEPNSNHEPLSLCRLKDISRVQRIDLFVLYDLRVVSRHHLLKLDDCEQEEAVVQHDGYAATKVTLHIQLSLAVEAWQIGRELVSLNEHSRQADSYGALLSLFSHIHKILTQSKYLF